MGDVNNSRSVNAAYVSGVKARLGQITTNTNFMFDLNASSTIRSGDVSDVKARSGLVLPQLPRDGKTHRWTPPFCQAII